MRDSPRRAAPDYVISVHRPMASLGNRDRFQLHAETTADLFSRLRKVVEALRYKPEGRGIDSR
jgi:hypothetical protein